MLLLETLIEEFRDYALMDEPAPIDLVARLEAAGLIVDELRQLLLIQHMYESI